MRRVTSRAGLAVVAVVTPPAVVAGFLVGLAFDRYIDGCKKRQELR